MLRSAALLIYLCAPLWLAYSPTPTGPAVQWVLSNLLAVVLVALFARGSAPVRVALSGFVTVLALLNVALVASYVLQGLPFNQAFFAHLDLTTLEIAWQVERGRLSAALAYLAAAPLVAWWAAGRAGASGVLSRRVTGRVGSSLVLGLILALTLGLSHPLQAYRDYSLASSRSTQRLQDEIAALRALPSAPSLEVTAPKNLVLIYLEGLEQTYFSDPRFPGLVPQLSALRDQGVAFTDLRQVPGTGWTIAGLVASQCGIPLLSERAGNQVLSEVDNPFREVTCAAEMLKQAGYVTQYVGGAPLSFAGKGNFLRDNGYDSVLGVDELPHPNRHNWGLYDDDLYANARVLFDGLAAGQAPFLLTLLTLDTHHPDGHLSPSCGAYPGSDLPLLDAVHCADRLVSEFVRHVQASPVADETVIAVVSDHLTMSPPVQQAFGTAPRRLLFFLLGADLPAHRHAGQATHFDIAPTLLEAVGVAGAEFAFGQSLLSHAQGRAPERKLSAEDFSGFKVEALSAGSDQP